MGKKGVVEGPKYNLANQKFGRLTPLWFYPKGSEPRKTASKCYWWRCRCECGAESDVTGNALRNGSIRSCGCLQVERAKELGHQNRKYAFGDSHRYTQLKHYQRAARTRDLAFELTDEQFFEISESDCHYCGAKPDLKEWGRSRKEGYKANGIDRKDPAIGYVLTNCVSCCKQCNINKQSETYDSFLSWINRVHAHQDLKHQSTFDLVAIARGDQDPMKWAVM